MKRQFLQLHGEACAVIADGIHESGHGIRFHVHIEIRRCALHQLALAGPIPDRWKLELLFVGEPLLHPFLKRFRGA